MSTSTRQRSMLDIHPTLFLYSLVVASSGCQSPFYADRGAGLGALAGAGAGALVGDAVGDAAAGAVIGAGLGALTGGAAGAAMDDMAAQNRAEIAAQLGRQVQAGSATLEEVIAMSRAGVDSRLIQNYVRTSGMSRQLHANDVIYLHQSGVANDVIQVMQSPPAPSPATQGPVVAQQAPVIVEEHYYGPPPLWAPYPALHHGYHARPPHGHMSWGVSIMR